MGQVNTGLKALMGSYDSNVASVVQANPQAPMRSVTDGAPDIDGLTTLELLYQLCKSEGTEVVGNPERAFAVYDASQGILNVYSKNTEFVHMVSHETRTMLAALECAQTSGASFMVCDEEVICVLKNVTASGKTYGDAALRALAKYQLATRPKHGDENATTSA
ncbi:hypothetical protein ACFSHT_24875 [Paraburkholderia silviterrae]|uniref:Uncharacterized protein n=1 Tax=Paraburkholderia silviterrae TaxID=2528715 RepID=A0A4R5MBJ8_9BURK|nr:hypothetical protein [Paraburkholderia silviterrae]TDG24177.1 hypothetical protein EYW47_11815 [Paraburkholderia silviterrae]